MTRGDHVKTRRQAKAHNKGVNEVVTREYTHIGWRTHEIGRGPLQDKRRKRGN